MTAVILGLFVGVVVCGGLLFGAFRYLSRRAKGLVIFFNVVLAAYFAYVVSASIHLDAWALYFALSVIMGAMIHVATMWVALQIQGSEAQKAVE